MWSAKGTDGKELTIQKIVELQNDSGVRLRKAEEKTVKLGDFAEEVLEKQKNTGIYQAGCSLLYAPLKEQESEKGGNPDRRAGWRDARNPCFDEEDGLCSKRAIDPKGI